MRWSLHDSIAYECAREAITDVIAIRMAAVYQAEAAGEACEHLRVEVMALARRRRELQPEDTQAINDIRQACGAIVRAHRLTTRK